MPVAADVDYAYAFPAVYYGQVSYNVQYKNKLVQQVNESQFYNGNIDRMGALSINRGGTRVCSNS